VFNEARSNLAGVCEAIQGVIHEAGQGV